MNNWSEQIVNTHCDTYNCLGDGKLTCLMLHRQNKQWFDLLFKSPFKWFARSPLWQLATPQPQKIVSYNSDLTLSKHCFQFLPKINLRTPAIKLKIYIYIYIIVTYNFIILGKKSLLSTI